MLAVFARIEPALRKSITFHNDTAFAQRALLRTMRALTIWFCDAYASWQNGGVENANGRLRRSLPRRIDIDKVSDQEIQDIVITANLTPRKCLGFKTPDEVNLVADVIVSDQEIVAFPNDLLEPEADCAAEQFFKEIALSADAIVIMHVLRDAVRGSGLYEGVGGNSIAGVKSGDVCVARNSFLVPRSVDEKSRSVSWETSQPQLGTNEGGTAIGLEGFFRTLELHRKRSRIGLTNSPMFTRRPFPKISGPRFCFISYPLACRRLQRGLDR